METRKPNTRVERLKQRLLAREADLQKEIKVTKDTQIRKVLRYWGALMRLGIKYIDENPGLTMGDKLAQETWRLAGDALARARRVRNRIPTEVAR